MRTLLHGGLVADDHRLAPRDILIEGESILDVRAGLRGRVEFDVEEDVSGHLVLPGAIDGHVHFEEPGHTEREDFGSGTRAAAAGGITTVLEHPLSDPPTTTAQRFSEKRDLVGRHTHVDFGLWGGAVPGNGDELSGMAEAGAAGFKAFTVDSEPDYPALGDADLLNTMATVQRLGSRLLVHAESNAIVTAASREVHANRRDPLAWSLAHPPVSEAEAVQRVVAFAEHTGVPLHLVHLTLPESVDAAQRARARGMTVRSETCPHYLLLDESALARLGPWAKTAPPLRSATAKDALWSLVRRNAVDFLASDHAPWTVEEKRAGETDIWRAPNGLQSLQFMTVLMLTAAQRSTVALPLVVRMLSANLAQWLGWYPRKGTIGPGSDADLAIYRRTERTLSAGELLNRHAWTPFDGFPVTYDVEATMLRGAWVYRDGAVRGPPWGRFTPPGSPRYRVASKSRATARTGAPSRPSRRKGKAQNQVDEA